MADELSVSALIILGTRLNSPIFDRLKFVNLFLLKSLKFIFKTIVKLRKAARKPPIRLTINFEFASNIFTIA